jgi:hypothetical protein
MGTKNHWIVYDWAVSNSKNLLVLVKIRKLYILSCCINSPNTNVTADQLNVKIVLYFANLVHF